MPIDRPTKRCEVCQTAFQPDPRVGDRQRVCQTLRCQIERKRRAQQRWLHNNPDYFKGRYPQLKEQIRTRQALRRAQRPACAEKEAATIQDELSPRHSKPLEMTLVVLTIQDEIIPKNTTEKPPLRLRVTCLYKSSERFVFSQSTDSGYTRQDGFFAP